MISFSVNTQSRGMADILVKLLLKHLLAQTVNRKYNGASFPGVEEQLSVGR